MTVLRSTPIVACSSSEPQATRVRAATGARNGVRLRTESELLAVAMALGASTVSGWSSAEEALVTRTIGQVSILSSDAKVALTLAADAVAAGLDPLGDALSLIHI